MIFIRMKAIGIWNVIILLMVICSTRKENTKREEKVQNNILLLLIPFVVLGLILFPVVMVGRGM